LLMIKTEMHREGRDERTARVVERVDLVYRCDDDGCVCVLQEEERNGGR